MSENGSGHGARAQLLAWVAPLTGLTVAHSSLTHTGALVIDFGSPLQIKDYVRGEWRLGVFNSAWRLQSTSAVFLASDDEPSRIRAALPSLRGLTLRSMNSDNELLESSFALDDKEIQVFQTYSGPDDRYDAWAVWTPWGKQLRVGPGTQLRWDEEMDTR